MWMMGRGARVNKQCSKELMMKSILFFAEGGLGRNIMATAVIRNLKKAYPDHLISVVASYPTAFSGNPNVHKIIRFGMDNIYELAIQGNEKDLLVFSPEPYRDPAYLRKEEHMIEVWCRMCGVSCDSVKPRIHLFKSELKRAEAYLKNFNKPVLVFQPFGGMNPEQNTEGSYYESRLGMHRRDLDLDVAVNVVNKLKDDFLIVHVKSPHQPTLDNTSPITADIREIAAMVKSCAAVLCIDSFIVHAAAAVDKKAVVLWSGTSPACLGYADHNNIAMDACPTPHCHRPNTYFSDSMPDNKPWNCPHEEVCTKHDMDTIVQAVLAELPKKSEKKTKGRRTKSVLGTKK